MYGQNIALSREYGYNFEGDPTHTLDYKFLLDSGTAITAVAVKGPVPTFTRASNAMSSNSSGNLAYAPHQILENANLGMRTGDLPSGWAWTAETGSISWTDIDGYSEGVFSATGAGQSLSNTITVTVAETYTVFAYISNSAVTSGSDLILRARVTSGTDADITDADWDSLGGVAGWYAVGFTMGAADTSMDVRMGIGTAGSATGSVTMSRPGIVKGLLPGVGVNVPAKLSGEPLGRWIGTDDGDEPLYDQPRFAHDSADSNARLGLLMEEARTNLGLGSEDASDNSNELRVTVSTNTAVAPDGNTTMDSVLETADTNTHQLNLDILTVSSSTLYTITYFVKKLNNDYVELSWIENGGSSLTPHIVFRFSTEAVVASSGITSSFIQNIGNGIYRIGFSATTESDTTGMLPIILTNTDGSSQQSYAGNTSNGVYVWGKQIEAGAFPTSYIPTTTASVTRAKDVNTTTDSSWLNPFALTVYAEYSTFIPASAAYEGGITRVRGQATGNEVLTLNTDTDAAEMDAARTTTGNSAAFSGLGPVAANAIVKVAMAVAQDDAAVSLDGAAVVTDNTVDPGDEATWELGIGGREDGTVQLNGHVRKLKFWNVRKPNAFLVSETT